MSRILLWAPNYAPELTGIPPIVTDAAEGLTARGHRVEVVAPMPNYPERRIPDRYRGRIWLTERLGEVTVHRNWLRVRPEERFADKVFYELSVSTLGLPSVLRAARRADVLVCVVPTVLAAAYSVAFLRSRVRVILWVQDLVSRAANVVAENARTRPVLTATAALEAWAVKRAERVIVCSPGFRDHYVQRGADAAAFEVLYNWADLHRIHPSPPDFPDQPVRFLYAGNLGYTQGFETLIDAVRQGIGDGHVDIVGEGNAARAVHAMAQDLTRVTVKPPVPRDDFPDLLAAHHVQIVLQRTVGAGANLPSKIATYLASGRPIIASIDNSTPAAQLLRESGAALLVEPESPTALARAMRELSEQAPLRREMGLAGRRFAEAWFDKDVAVARLEEIVLGPRRSPRVLGPQS